MPKVNPARIFSNFAIANLKFLGRPIDPNAIKGFSEAYADRKCPVYSNFQHESFGLTNDKHLEWLYGFRHGDAYFYIPPFPFKGEINAYNFLAAADLWSNYKKLGIITPNSTFTVINANDRFCEFEPETDQMFKDQCEKMGINVVYNTKLEAVDGKSRMMTLNENGQTSEKEFHHLYVIPPVKPCDNLVESGLATSVPKFTYFLGEQKPP